MPEEPTDSCPFCNLDPTSVRAVNGRVFAIEDRSPVTPLHLLVIPFRHCHSFFEMTKEEIRDAWELIRTLKQEILDLDKGVSGFNIGVNCGEDAGQTIFHAHIHLIPRRKKDTPSPRGGVRGVIPDRMNY